MKIPITIHFAILTLLSLKIHGQSDTIFIKSDTQKSVDKRIYKTDTILVETSRVDHILIGTTILPWTNNQQHAKGFGINLEKVKLIHHNIEPAHAQNEKIKVNSINNSPDDVIIDINVVDDCGFSFLCDIAIVDSTILNVIYYGYGSTYNNSCSFGLTYFIKKESYPAFFKLKFVMINGKRKTLQALK